MTHIFTGKKPLILSIEGNIGSGKSTLVDILKRTYKKNVIFMAEPVDEWVVTKGNDGKNILETFYQDMKRWSYSFQNFAYLTRLKALYETIESLRLEGTLSDTIIITERSTMTDRNVFAEILHKAGNISDLEWNMYLKWYEYFNIEIDGVIYIKTSVNKCHERINKRDRSGESNISKEYLETLDNHHESWLRKYSKKLEISGEEDFKDNLDLQENMLNNICNFVSSTFGVNIIN